MSPLTKNMSYATPAIAHGLARNILSIRPLLVANCHRIRKARTQYQLIARPLRHHGVLAAPGIGALAGIGPRLGTAATCAPPSSASTRPAIISPRRLFQASAAPTACAAGGSSVDRRAPARPAGAARRCPRSSWSGLGATPSQRPEPTPAR